MTEMDFRFLCSSNRPRLCEAESCLVETPDIYEHQGNGLLIRACEIRHALEAAEQKTEVETTVHNYMVMTRFLPFSDVNLIKEQLPFAPMDTARIGGAAARIAAELTRVQEGYLRAGDNERAEELEEPRGLAQKMRDHLPAGKMGRQTGEQFIGVIETQLKAFRLARAVEQWTPGIKTMIAYLIGKENETEN